MNGQLQVYDVDQQGWEQEGRGFDANATHVLLHLIKAEADKSFADAEVVQTELAPDAAQYALRLGRWAGLRPTQLHGAQAELLPRFQQELLVPHTLMVGRAALREAVTVMARNLHDRGHAKTEAAALADQPASAQTAAGLLLVCANLQADVFGFSLPAAFTARLAGLRERFGIPQPDGGGTVTETTAPVTPTEQDGAGN
jgi:hypothetical protein